MAAFPVPNGVARADQLVLRAAVSAYLGRYRGETRLHTESDLRVFLGWCVNQNLDPLAAVWVDIERYLRWLQDERRYQPSTVSRRLSVVVGFYRVCVIDQILAHSPADYVRRPTVPAESPTLGLAIDRAVDGRDHGPVLRNAYGVRMDRHAATEGSSIWPTRQASGSRGCPRTCSGTRS
jgi:hypothetical protein